MNSEDFLMDFLSDQLLAGDSTPTSLYTTENIEEEEDLFEESGDDDDGITMMMLKDDDDETRSSDKGNKTVEPSIMFLSEGIENQTPSEPSSISMNSCAAQVSPVDLSSSKPTGHHHPEPMLPAMLEQTVSEGVQSAYRGYRNGIVTGVRIRIPYILQSVIYAAIFRTPSEFRKVRFVIKQMFHHGKNLGSFVGIYKLITYICRNHLNIRNGIDSWIAGLIGGSIAFGESKGISGAVNNQIVLYLFARGVDGGLRALATNGYIPDIMDITTPKGFRLFAGFSLALILYLTEYQPKALRSGFMSTMEHLYHESNKGPIATEMSFAPFVTVVTVCLLLGYWFPQLRLENVLQYVDDSITWNNTKDTIGKVLSLVKGSRD